ncbi:hypothetical protein Q3G72_006679 [Acer saccharum]|nr:hypothetical protein Q3G72_006679 [Acer saccharum]
MEGDRTFKGLNTDEGKEQRHGKKDSGVPLTYVNRSYAEAVKNDNKRDSEKKIVMSWLSYREDEEWLSRCAFGTMKDFMSVQLVNQKLEDRGFVFSSSYLGRKNVLWSFESETDRDGFVNNNFFWKDCFISMSIWRDSMIPKSHQPIHKCRWVEVYRVPVNCWSNTFFKKLGGQVGEVLKIDEVTVGKESKDGGTAGAVDGSWINDSLDLRPQANFLNSNLGDGRKDFQAKTDRWDWFSSDIGKVTKEGAMAEKIWKLDMERIPRILIGLFSLDYRLKGECSRKGRKVISDSSGMDVSGKNGPLGSGLLKCYQDKAQHEDSFSEDSPNESDSLLDPQVNQVVTEAQRDEIQELQLIVDLRDRAIEE